MSILFVLTSVNTNLLGGKTVRMPDKCKYCYSHCYMQGWFVPEAAHPYKILSPYYTIDFASPAGSNPPVDESSVKASF